jgi:uncharacterized protein (DUF2062 family)
MKPPPEVSIVVPRSWWKRRVVDVITAQLRQGTTPEKIALTIALGCVLSVFPILGLTTPLCAIVALSLRLNQPLIQLVNYLCYPLQLLLLIPLYRGGEWLGAPHLTLSIPQMMLRFKAGPLRFIADFATVALGGVGIWCLAAPLVAGVIYLLLRPPLRLLAARTVKNAASRNPAL